MIKLYDINNTTCLSGHIGKINHQALNKPISFYMRPLNIKDAHQMADLSTIIYENLKDDQNCFIHKHDKQYFRDVFDKEDIKYVGVFVGKHLIAMSYLRIVTENDVLQEELPFHGLDLRGNNKSMMVAALGADSVHPDFRGNDLNYYMIQYRSAFAKQNGCNDCVSIVDRNNIWNMRPYFKNGFNMFGSAVDPADNGKIALFHKPLYDAPLKTNANNLEYVDFKSFGLIDRLLNNGQAGVHFDTQTNSLGFVKTQYYRELKYIKNRVNAKQSSLLFD